MNLQSSVMPVSLYVGKTLRFSPLDYEKDAPIESGWTHNAGYLRLLGPEPAMPLSPEQVKEKYKEIEKAAEQYNQFYFALHTCSDDRLIGFAQIFWIEWSNGHARVKLGIGDPADWGKGYGAEALDMLLRFAFIELNLHRLTAVVQGYNRAALRLFSKAGFVEEVRRRQAVYRDGKRWDLIMLGLLDEEWRASRKGEGKE